MGILGGPKQVGQARHTSNYLVSRLCKIAHQGKILEGRPLRPTLRKVFKMFTVGV